MCDTLATVVGRQFITLSVEFCVQHDGREAASASAETCYAVDIRQCRRRHRQFRSAVRPFGQILLPRYLVNGLDDFDKTDRK